MILQWLSHFTMVFLVKSKEEIPTKINEYIERIKTRWYTRSRLRYNYERDINEKIISWCENKSIELDKII